MGGRQSFGGAWTEAKLDVVEAYLNAYMTIMRGNRRAANFRVTYVDGFAGSGRRYAASAPTDPANLFADFQDADTDSFYGGSASRALAVDPPFDRYVFIESRRGHVEELSSLVEAHPDRKDSVLIIRGDANEVIPTFCRSLRTSDRVLVFLDPYGMEVSWATVQSIAATKKIDLWVLVPLGQAIVRLLTTHSPPPEEWARALTRFFGTDGWRDSFYVTRKSDTLFGETDYEVRDADFERITNYIVGRLRQEFAGVLDTPLLLRNRHNTPIYLLCFAASNPTGAPIAVKIARDIVAKRFRHGG